MAFFNEESANVIQHIALPLEALGFALVILEVYYPPTIAKIEHKINEINRNSHSRIISILGRLPDPMISIVVIYFLLYEAFRDLRPRFNTFSMSERDIFLRPASNYYTYQYAYVKDSDNLYYDYNENAKVIIRTIILAIVCYQIFYEKDKIVWYECIGYILAWFFLNLRPFLVLRSFLIFLLYVGYFLVIYVWSLPVRFISLTIRFLNQITNNKAFASIGLLLALLGLVGEIYQVVTLHFGK